MLTKVPRSKALNDAMRRTNPERRPLCPTCWQRAPGPDEIRDDWLECFGHRDEHGEPCRGFHGRKHEAPILELPPHLRAPPTVQMFLFALPSNDQATPTAERVKRARRIVGTVAPQLVLFTDAHSLWCDAAESEQPAQTGVHDRRVRVREAEPSERNQERRRA